MDSPGWQWGCPPKDVEDQLVTMKAVAENMGVAPDALKERLVVVLLHKAEDVARLVGGSTCHFSVVTPHKIVDFPSFPCFFLRDNVGALKHWRGEMWRIRTLVLFWQHFSRRAEIRMLLWYRS